MSKRIKEPNAKMKDSGMEFVGMIPDDWDIKRVKEIATWMTGFTPPSNNETLYDGTDTWITIRDLSDEKQICSSAKTINGSLVPKDWKTPKNSLLFSFKLSIGQVAFNTEALFTNEAICSFLPSSKIDLNYLYYSGPVFIVKNCKYNIYGAQLLNQELIANAIIPVPSKKVQASIAAFLDQQTSKIDKEILLLKNKVELLDELKYSTIYEAVTKGIHQDVKLKDSGIEWIGMIPSHWTVKRAKDVSIIQKGKANEMYEEHVFNSLPCIDTNFLRNKEDSVTYNIIGKKVKPNDILILWDGANAGELFKNTSFGYLGSTFAVFKTHVNNDFFYYYLKGIEKKTRSNLTGMGIPHVNGNTLKQIPFILPTATEQKEIVDTLDIQIFKINKKHELITKKIKLLKEYKQSLVYEAVTGNTNLEEIK